MSYVHLCGWASQPDIQIACDESYTTPKWGPHRAPDGKPLQNGVHQADDGRYYCFEDDRVTCVQCLKIVAKRPRRLSS